MTTGISEAIYLGGLPVGRGPSVISPREEVAQTRDRYLDGSLAVDSLALPWAGAPAVIEKRPWSISWEALSPADVAFLNRLVATRGVLTFGFVPWLMWSESFLIRAGAARTGVLSRRSALAVISSPPVGASTKYATTAARGGEDFSAWASISVTLGASVGYRTPWTASGVPSSDEFIVISYAPEYRVVVGEAQQTFSLPHLQGQSLTLEEV